MKTSRIKENITLEFRAQEIRSALTLSGWHLILNFWEQQAKSVSQLTKPLRLKEGDRNVGFRLEAKKWEKVEKREAGTKV